MTEWLGAHIGERSHARGAKQLDEAHQIVVGMTDREEPAICHSGLTFVRSRRIRVNALPGVWKLVACI